MSSTIMDSWLNALLEKKIRERDTCLGRAKQLERERDAIRAVREVALDGEEIAAIVEAFLQAARLQGEIPERMLTALRDKERRAR